MQNKMVKLLSLGLVLTLAACNPAGSSSAAEAGQPKERWYNKQETIGGLSFSIWNYSKVYIANVKVEGRGLGFAQGVKNYGEAVHDGTACCIEITKGPTAKVTFEADLGDGDKKHELIVPVENYNDKLPGNATLHYLPGNTGVLEISMSMAWPRRDLLQNQLKKMGLPPAEINKQDIWNDKTQNEIARERFPD